MKLIDILVQELPKRGGWPDGVAFIVQDSDGEIKGASEHANLIRGVGAWIRSGQKERVMEPFKLPLADDEVTAVITREQYEAAMKQSVWDGTGLPPVGVECEWQDKNTKQWIQVLVVYASEWVTVIRENKKVDPVELAIENYGDDARCQFRLPRSEAERKRDESIEALHNNLMRVKYKAEEIYNAIAEGKIPGIKLEKE